MYRACSFRCKRTTAPHTHHDWAKQSCTRNSAWISHSRRKVRRNAENKYRTQDSRLYECTLAARHARRSGLLASGIMLGLGLTVAMSAHLLPSPNFEKAMEIVLFMSVGALVTASLFWWSQRGQISVEWHSGKLWIEFGVPPIWVLCRAPVPISSIQVCETNFYE
jgi:hypothetical protein